MLRGLRLPYQPVTWRSCRYRIRGLYRTYGDMRMAVFIKRNHSAYKDQLLCEARGLALLSQYIDPVDIAIPEVFYVDEHELQLPRIAAQRMSSQQFEQLGRGLAHLHAHRQQQFGFAEHNYIGLNPQQNGLSDNWGEFFVQRRLAYQLTLMVSSSLRKSFSTLLDRHRKKLVAFLNQHCQFASVVHGDLWSGNVMADSDRVWLIDPAVYYADREVDLAMTEMFGAFPTVFYRAYDEVLPRCDAYPQKKVIYNLYHYLNHFNLFGSGYEEGCCHGFDIIRSL